jgi:hypothetical protein
MSSTSSPGLPNVSANTSRVLSVMARSKLAGSRGSTSVAVMPKRGRVCTNMLCEPP